MDTSESGRLLDAEAVNRLAQAINDEAEGRVPGEVSEISTSQRGEGEHQAASQEGAAGITPLASEEEEQLAGVYPPDISPTIEVGGSIEDQAGLREEYRT